jgi:hypothetical protein
MKSHYIKVSCMLFLFTLLGVGNVFLMKMSASSRLVYIFPRGTPVSFPIWFAIVEVLSCLGLVTIILRLPLNRTVRYLSTLFILLGTIGLVAYNFYIVHITSILCRKFCMLHSCIRYRLLSLVTSHRKIFCKLCGMVRI